MDRDSNHWGQRKHHGAEMIWVSVCFWSTSRVEVSHWSIQKAKVAKKDAGPFGILLSWSFFYWPEAFKGQISYKAPSSNPFRNPHRFWQGDFLIFLIICMRYIRLDGGRQRGSVAATEMGRDGGWRTSRAKGYPPRLCQALAALAARTAWRVGWSAECPCSRVRPISAQRPWHENGTGLLGQSFLQCGQKLRPVATKGEVKVVEPNFEHTQPQGFLWVC